MKTVLDHFFEYGVDHRNRLVDCTGDVDESLACRVTKGLICLDLSSSDDITLLINSPGGDEIAGMAIYDAIRNCKSAVIGLVHGEASSMGSIILQACDMRVMSSNAVQLIHNGTIEVCNEYTNALRWVEHMKDFTVKMEDIYLEQIREKHPKYTRKKLKELIRHDMYLTAKKAVELGLASKVI